MKYPADLASCIWKALGFVLRLIHTNYAECYIAGHWKTGPKGLNSSMRGHPLLHTHTGETLGGYWVPCPPVPTPTNFSKHLLTDWLRVSTVELCGWKKRDLEICASSKVCVCGGGDLLPAPLPGKWGGNEHLPCPPCSYAYVACSVHAAVYSGHGEDSCHGVCSYLGICHYTAVKLNKLSD